MKKSRLDIFEVLKNIDNNNMKYYDSLDDSKKQQFSPILVHQWLIGQKSKTQLALLDGLVNAVTYPLYKNPNVLYKLMVCCSDGSHDRYKYLRKKKKKTMPSICIRTIMQYLQCSTKDAKIYLNNYNISDIVEMAEEMGYNDKDIKTILKLND